MLYVIAIFKNKTQHGYRLYDVATQKIYDVDGNELIPDLLHSRLKIENLEYSASSGFKLVNGEYCYTNLANEADFSCKRTIVERFVTKYLTVSPEGETEYMTYNELRKVHYSTQLSAFTNLFHGYKEEYSFSAYPTLEEAEQELKYTDENRAKESVEKISRVHSKLKMIGKDTCTYKVGISGDVIQTSFNITQDDHRFASIIHIDGITNIAVISEDILIKEINKNRPQVIRIVCLGSNLKELYITPKSWVEINEREKVRLEVVIPNSAIADGTAMMARCETLARVDISEMNVSKLEKLDYAFIDSKYMRYLDFNHSDLLKLQSARGIFTGCGNEDTSNTDAILWVLKRNKGKQ